MPFVKFWNWIGVKYWHLFTSCITLLGDYFWAHNYDELWSYNILSILFHGGISFLIWLNTLPDMKEVNRVQNIPVYMPLDLESVQIYANLFAKSFSVRKCSVNSGLTFTACTGIEKSLRDSFQECYFLSTFTHITHLRPEKSRSVFYKM